MKINEFYNNEINEFICFPLKYTYAGLQLHEHEVEL
jgi:hypothetical protein